MLMVMIIDAIVVAKNGDEDRDERIMMAMMMMTMMIWTDDW